MALQYDFLDNNFFNTYTSVETPEVKLEMPLLDDPLDISEWSSRVTSSGVPIVKPSSKMIVNNTQQVQPEEQSSTQVSIGKNSEATAISIMNGLIKRGIKPHEAAGITGNLYAESGFKTNNTSNDLGVIGGGIAGFRGSNLTALKQFAKNRGKSWGDLDTQLDYILSTISPDVKNRLNNSKNPHEASEAWAYYEKYAGYNYNPATARKAGWSSTRIKQEHNKRSAYSKKFYDLWKSQNS